MWWLTPSRSRYAQCHPLQCNGEQPAPLALIVDHKLREESTREAQRVAQTAQALGLAPLVLTLDWRNRPPTVGQTQARARDERYRALAQACAARACSTLLLGHHRGTGGALFGWMLVKAQAMPWPSRYPNKGQFQAMTSARRRPA